MIYPTQLPEGKLAYTVTELSLATGIGRNNINLAMYSGELKSHAPVVEGRTIARRLIFPKDAKAWLATFPEHPIETP